MFDEPLSNLNAELRGQMRVEIAKLHQRLDATMIYVTHDQVEAMTLGNRIAVLNEGRLEQFDTPMNLYHHPRNLFVTKFIGSPPMNMIEGSISKKENNLFFNDHSGKLAFKIPEGMHGPILSRLDKPLIMGIRSERISNEKLPESAHFKGTVITIELLGNEQIISVSGLSEVVISRIPTKNIYALDDKVDLYLDLSSIYFFDKETALRIVQTSS